MDGTRKFRSRLWSLLIFCGIYSTAHGADLSKLYDSFDGSSFSQAGGVYYRDNREQSAGTYEFQNAVKRTGSGALKLTVRPFCNPTDLGCSERAEIWEKTELWASYDAPVWYGFSVKFADPIPVDDHRYLIAQWKREILPEAAGDFSPFLGFRYRSGKLFVTVETNYHLPSKAQPVDGVCPSGTIPVWLRPETNQMRALIVKPSGWVSADEERYTSCTDKIAVTDHGNTLPEVTSGWIDFAVLSKPGPDGSGHIEIFANGKWIVSVKGAIGHADFGLGEKQYFKFGPYRDGAPNEWALYYDDFTRSSDCNDVLKDREACRLITASGIAQSSPLSSGQYHTCRIWVSISALSLSGFRASRKSTI